MPRLVIIFITYKRTDYALKTIRSVCKNLQYSGGISWYVCDDGSRGEHYTAVLNELAKLNQHICGHHTEKLGYGGGVNKAWKIASQTSPVTLWLEDDWELQYPFDFDLYVKLLLEHADIGMIRLGHLPIDQEAESIGIDGYVYLDFHKNKQYYFSGNPHLKHDRFGQIYGMYPVGRQPGDTETHYDSIVRGKNGPGIIWPLAIGDRHLFGHIGAEKSY